LTAAAWLALAAQLAMLYAPSLPDAVPPPVPFADKLVHCVAFALATAVWSRLTGRTALVAALFSAHGVVSEFIQAALPARSADPWDALADLAGVALGIWVAATLRPPPEAGRSGPGGA
jgi:VanZ family protein